LKTDIGISREQISQERRFILSCKVRENEFCRVVGTMDLGYAVRSQVDGAQFMLAHG